MSNGGSKKKQKSSEFDAEDDRHIKLGPAVKVWSHEGFILTSKIAKKCQKRLKNRCSTGLQKIVKGQMRVSLDSKRYKYPNAIAKLNLSYQVESHERSTF